MNSIISRQCAWHTVSTCYQQEAANLKESRATPGEGRAPLPVVQTMHELTKSASISELEDWSMGLIYF